MRIAQIIDSLNWGGAQKLMVTFAKEAASRDIDKLIIISLRKDYPNVLFADQLKEVGAEVFYLPNEKLMSSSRISLLIKLLQKNKIHVVHTHLLYSNIVGGIAARLCGIPAVASVHNVQVDPMRANKSHYLLETWVLKYFNYGIIAVGQIVAKIEKLRYKSQHIRIIPNAVEPISPLSSAERQKVRLKFLIEPEGLLLISVGRLRAQKAFGDLFSVISQTVESFPDVQLIIAGEGKQRKELEEKIRSLNIEDNVQLLGGRNDVPVLLSASDLFISSSHWEGLPIAVLEGMSAGLPIVATRVGDVAFVVADGESGLLTEPGDIDGLANALRKLLSDDVLRKKMGVAGRARIETSYSPQIWVDQLLAYYKEAMTNA